MLRVTWVQLNKSTTSRCVTVVLSLLCSNCGKTPAEDASSGSGGSASVASSAGTSSSEGGSADAPDAAFNCTSTAQPGDTVSVPAGTFPMGCATGDTECQPDEIPKHSVTLSAFEIDKTEVTQDQYAACVQAKACAAPSCSWDCSEGSLPAHCIEQADAEAFCTWAGKRLPTEAEWEMAARGTDGRIYPWGNTAPDCTLVNMAGCGDQATPVGTFPSGASPYGALDMSGNVVEMVSDWYDATYYQKSPSMNPTGPATGTRYAGRGGGYKSEAIWQRGSSRDWYDLSDSSESLGFRCAE